MDNITFLIPEKLQFLPPISIFLYLFCCVSITFKIIMLILLIIYALLLIVTLGDIFLDDLGYPRKISALRCSFVLNIMILTFFVANYIINHGWFHLLIFISLLEIIYKIYWFKYSET